MNYLSLDVGTTCCKCQLFSEEGDILFYHPEEYPLKLIDGNEYVDVDGLWVRVCNMIALASSKGTISSISISSFGEAFVLLDENDDVIFYPMLYTDPRGAEEASDVLSAFGAEYCFTHTGVVPHSMFSVSKLLYIRKHYPEIFARGKKVMLICDYLGYLLTGKRAIDYALATRTGVFNINTFQFDAEILSRFSLDASLFSQPLPTGTIVGEIREEIVKNCKLVLGGHDQVCAALGAGILEAGEAVDGLGTVECVTAVFGQKPDDVKMGMQGYCCTPYAIHGLYCTYMFNYSCGTLTSWFRNKLLHGYQGEQTDFFSYIESKMTDEPSEVLALPYFDGAATPYQNLNAKGAFLNLRTDTTDGQIYQSILESLAMEMRLNCETVEEYGISVRRAVATGGGANSEKWLAIKTGVQNIPFKTLRSSEGGLCGLAMIQAVAMKGISYDQARDIFVQYKREFYPEEERCRRYTAKYEKYKNLYKTIKEFY